MDYSVSDTGDLKNVWVLLTRVKPVANCLLVHHALPLAFHQLLNSALDFLGVAFQAESRWNALCRWHRSGFRQSEWLTHLHKLT